jgi:GNAT superfamily N-acetyltransferase
MDACFWLLEEGERVGTLALSRGAVGNSLLLRLSSLYVLPTHRGRGVATRALERMRSVLGSWRYAVRLETCWTWQAARRLTHRIAVWEAWGRKQGYRVETPKIPGLEYPSWEELTRRWSAARGAP